MPEHILAKFDLDKIEPSNRTYIDPQLTEQSSDIVYYAEMQDGTKGYLYLLIEHQTDPKPLMPLRMLKYQIAIIEDHLLQHPKDTKLPIVFSIIFYTGATKPYPYSLDIFDLFSDRDFAEKTLLKPAHLVDITQISDEQIKKHQFIGLLELAQKHIRDPDFALIAKDLAEIINNICLRGGVSKNLLLYIECTLYYIINIANINNPEQFLKNLGKNNIFVEEIMGSLAHKWLEEGIAKGLDKGKAEGKAEAKKEVAKIMLVEGSDVNFIKKVTGLSFAEINKLKLKEE